MIYHSELPVTSYEETALENAINNIRALNEVPRSASNKINNVIKMIWREDETSEEQPFEMDMLVDNMNIAISSIMSTLDRANGTEILKTCLDFADKSSELIKCALSYYENGIKEELLATMLDNVERLNSTIINYRSQMTIESEAKLAFTSIKIDINCLRNANSFSALNQSTITFLKNKIKQNFLKLTHLLRLQQQPELTSQRYSRRNIVINPSEIRDVILQLPECDQINKIITKMQTLASNIHELYTQLQEPQSLESNPDIQAFNAACTTYRNYDAEVRSLLKPLTTEYGIDKKITNKLFPLDANILDLNALQEKLLARTVQHERKTALREQLQFQIKLNSEREKARKLELQRQRQAQQQIEQIKPILQNHLNKINQLHRVLLQVPITDQAYNRMRQKFNLAYNAYVAYKASVVIPADDALNDIINTIEVKRAEVVGEYTSQIRRITDRITNGRDAPTQPAGDDQLFEKLKDIKARMEKHRQHHHGYENTRRSMFFDQSKNKRRDVLFKSFSTLIDTVMLAEHRNIEYIREQIKFLSNIDLTGENESKPTKFYLGVIKDLTTELQLLKNEYQKNSQLTEPSP